MTDSGTRRRRLAADWTMVAVVFGVAFACYWPALNGAPLWDDPAHITSPHLRDWSGLVKIWTVVGATQEFYPVLHSAFWVQQKLWGDSMLGYHLVNVFLHAGSCCFLALVLRRLWTGAGGGPAGSVATDFRRVPWGAEWLAAMLFAVHPVCVESVAWITEQKNTLSLAFMLLSTLVYLDFRVRPRRPRYWLALFLFFLALASKPSTVTLPAALLVLVWWKEGTLGLRRDVVPTLPFFAVAIAAGLVTVWVETHHVGAQGENFDWTLLERTLLAGRIVWFYLGKLVWPLDLIFYYERWDVAAEANGWWPYLFGSVALTVALWAIRHRTRAPLATWLLFVGTLFPVLGFFNLYGFNFSQVADHFQYLSCMVFLAATAGTVAILLQRLAPMLRMAGFGLLAIVLVVLGLHARSHSALYVDNETLFSSVTARNPESWMAHHNTGLSIAKAGGRSGEAIAAFRRAIELNPTFPDSHLAMGIELMKQPGSRQEALAAYERALQLRPYYAEALSALGVDLAAQPGRLDDAIRHFEEALRIRPLRPDIHANYANALARDPAHLPKAIAHFEEALHLRPNYPKALNDYGAVLARLPDHRSAAIGKFEQALSLAPAYHEARYNLAATLAEMPGRAAEALSHYEQILREVPGFAQAHYGIANVLARDPRRAADALDHYRTALRLQPEFAEAHANLGNLLSRSPDGIAEAVSHYQTALGIDPSLAWVHFNLANILGQHPDHVSDAASHYEAALRLKPDFPDALNGLAILFAQQGRYEEARERWRKALEIDPDYRTARENLRLLDEMLSSAR